MICVSIVSHAQSHLVKNLLDDFEKYCANDIRVILTINILEATIDTSGYHFPINIIYNAHPKGFGENHNYAFRHCDAPYFCVLNPDIRLVDNPFPRLIKILEEKALGVIGPRVVDEAGQLQDSARKFMTIKEVYKRIFLSQKEILQTDYPDWIAGMFMVFKKEIYQLINGFDATYFMYCEDMDLCARLSQNGYRVYVEKQVIVVHHAQRESHKKLKYLCWHVQSIIKFLYRYYFYIKRESAEKVKHES